MAEGGGSGGDSRGSAGAATGACTPPKLSMREERAAQMFYATLWPDPMQRSAFKLGRSQRRG